LALELAKLTSDGAAGTPDMLATVNQLVEKQLAADPSMQELEKDHPGLIKHIAKVITDESQRQTEATMPKLQTRLQDLFASTMSAAELRQAINFYASPIGKKLIAAQQSGSNMEAMFATAVETGKVSSSDIVDRNRAISAQAAQNFSAEDQAALLAFGKTPAFLKVQQLGPKVTAITTQWSNETTPEDDAAMDTLVTDALAAYMAKASEKGGK
jgi:hypothetical protein